MDILNFEYFWQITQRDGVPSGNDVWSIELLKGKEDCIRALEILKANPEQDRICSSHAISEEESFSDFIRWSFRVAPDLEKAIWTIDDYAPFQVMISGAAAVRFPKHRIEEDWNPSIYFRMKRTPSIKMFDSTELGPFVKRIRGAIAAGQLIVWDDLEQMILIHKSDRNWVGICVARIRT